MPLTAEATIHGERITDIINYDGPPISNFDPLTAAAGLTSVVGGLLGGKKMSYADFIKARDEKLQELLRYGAQDSMDPVRGWGVELNKGFTHDQIKKNLLKDYTADYNQFLQVVFWPVLQRVNPTVYAQLRASEQAQSTLVAPVPVTPIPAPPAPSVAEASVAQSQHTMIVSVIAIVILVIALLTLKKKG